MNNDDEDEDDNAQRKKKVDIHIDILDSGEKKKANQLVKQLNS